MRVERFIAWRFMLKATEEGRFSAMTLFGWLALAIGVWAMGSLLSVMYGFEGALRDRVLSAYPHVLVRPNSGNLPFIEKPGLTESFKKISSAHQVTPFLETEMIVQSDMRVLGAVIQGLTMEDLATKQSLLTSGVLPNLESSNAEAILGNELADRLGVSVGSKINIISPIQSDGALGLVPRTLEFNVVGIFSSGHYQFDQDFLYVPMIDARDLLREGNVISGWQIWGDSYDSADGLKADVGEVIPSDLKAETWGEFNASLFHSLKLEQFSMFFIFSFALSIAVMNIAITLMMYVVHKRKNIGILRALGASGKQIRNMFVWQGMWIGGTGLLVGAILTALTFVYMRYFMNFQLPAIYYDRTIPIEIRPLSLALIYGIGVALIFLATLYPAKRAVDTNPIEAIKA